MQPTYNSADLAPSERAAVEKLLGRKLESDETIKVITERRAETGDIQVKDLANRGELGPDGLYDTERFLLKDRDTAERRRQRERAVESIREIRKAIVLGEDLELKDLVNTGRRM